jgi:NAD(P)-dependent dehydrogenase (short-subunit alcohol dehydrogenase family)
MSLSNQNILITGAGGGLGSSAALALAKQGAHIILLDKSIPKLEKTYDAIVAANAIEPMLYPFDLAGASEEQYQELAEALKQHYGAIHGILHAAVEFSAYTPLAAHKTLDWGHSLNVNLNAPFILTRVLLPVLQNSPHAAIVFISDSGARQAKAYMGAYGVSKIALEGFATILADELASAGKIRVNTLIPGPIDSPLRKKAYPAENKDLLPNMTSLDAYFVYLFSAASLGITGQIIDAQSFKLSGD